MAAELPHDLEFHMTIITKQPPIPWPKRLGRLARRILRFLAILFLAIAIVFYLLQEKLIFHGCVHAGERKPRLVL